MILTTTDYVPGYEVVEALDVVRGSTVRARHLGRDITASLKNLVGGEVRSYTDLLVDAREQAIGRLIADAQDVGADAVINIRFMTSAVMHGASEILAYGTAVKLRKTQ